MLTWVGTVHVITLVPALPMYRCRYRCTLSDMSVLMYLCRCTLHAETSKPAKLNSRDLRTAATVPRPPSREARSQLSPVNGKQKAVANGAWPAPPVEHNQIHLVHVVLHVVHHTCEGHARQKSSALEDNSQGVFKVNKFGQGQHFKLLRLRCRRLLDLVGSKILDAGCV